MLRDDFQYYLDHQTELIKEYSGKFIVIKNKKLLGAYSTPSEAYSETAKTEAPGTFLIQHCLPGTDSVTQVFHSQVLVHA